MLGIFGCGSSKKNASLAGSKPGLAATDAKVGVVVIVAHTIKAQRIRLGCFHTQIAFPALDICRQRLPDFTTGNRLLSPASDQRGPTSQKVPEFRRIPVWLT